MVRGPLMFLSEWREFPSGLSLSFLRFRPTTVGNIVVRAKDLSVPPPVFVCVYTCMYVCVCIYIYIYIYIYIHTLICSRWDTSVSKVVGSGFIILQRNFLFIFMICMSRKALWPTQFTIRYLSKM